MALKITLLLIMTLGSQIYAQSDSALCAHLYDEDSHSVEQFIVDEIQRRNKKLHENNAAVSLEIINEEIERMIEWLNNQPCVNYSIAEIDICPYFGKKLNDRSTAVFIEFRNKETSAEKKLMLHSTKKVRRFTNKTEDNNLVYGKMIPLEKGHINKLYNTCDSLKFKSAETNISSKELQGKWIRLDSIESDGNWFYYTDTLMFRYSKTPLYNESQISAQGYIVNNAPSFYGQGVGFSFKVLDTVNEFVNPNGLYEIAGRWQMEILNVQIAMTSDNRLLVFKDVMSKTTAFGYDKVLFEYKKLVPTKPKRH